MPQLVTNIVSSLAVLALAHLLAACSIEMGPTRLVLVADTDIESLTRARFVVQGHDGRAQIIEAPLRPGAPAWHVFEKQADAPWGPYEVVVTGLAGTSPVVERRASVLFSPHRTLVVPLHLVASCRAPSDCEAAGQVCSHEGCRAEEILPGELEPWAGEPPTLMGSPPDVGASDAGTTPAPTDEDARAPRVDAGPAAVRDGGGSGSEQPTTDAASPPRTDAGGSCIPDQTCDHTEACAASGDCEPRCDEALECVLGCGSASNCKPQCSEGSACDVSCGEASNCDVECRGACLIDCDQTSNCRPRCREGASCDITCPADGGNCDKVECQDGAQCVLRCAPGRECKFDKCDGDERACSETVVVCNRACP